MTSIIIAIIDGTTGQGAAALRANRLTIIALCLIIDREAGEIIRLVTSVCLSVCLSVRVFISRSIQNGWAFKMVVVSTGCAIAVDYAFNLT